MRLLSEVLGALGAGALVLVLARQVGIGARRAVGAVALVPVVVAALLAAPALRDDAERLLDRREANASLTALQAELLPGSERGLAVDFLTWVEAQFGERDTFHLLIGRIPDEVHVAGVGVRQAAILQWSLFQLAPHLAIEQSDQARDLEPGEGRNADWLVFYEYDPADYRGGRLSEIMTYAPGFAIGRTKRAR